MNLTKNSVLIILAIFTILCIILFYFLGSITKETSDTVPVSVKEGYNNYRPSSGYTADEADVVTLNSGVYSINTNYDNYNHYSQTSFPTVFYGPNGATAKLIISDEDNQNVSVVDGAGKTTKYIIDKKVTGSKSDNMISSFGQSIFTGPSGEIAKIILDKAGDYAIKITKPDGSIRNYTTYNNYTRHDDDPTSITDTASLMSFLDNKTFAGNTSGLAYITTDDAGKPIINITKLYDASYPLIFLGLGGKAKLIVKSDKSQTISIPDTNGNITVYDTNVPIHFNSVYDSKTNSGSNTNSNTNSNASSYTTSISSFMSNISDRSFKSHSGAVAKLIIDNVGRTVIQITNLSNPSYPLLFFGMDGKAKLTINKDDSETISITDGNKTTTYTIDIPVKYIKADANLFDTTSTYKSTSNSNSNSSSTFTNKKIDGSVYDSVFPVGVSKSMIPDGEENLYILKSQIVPPVCPSQCANGASKSKGEKCPPCPGCERCKEPDFACKKVPNYGKDESFGGWDHSSKSQRQEQGQRQGQGTPNGNWGNGGGNGSSYGYSGDPKSKYSVTSEYLPVPVLTDFSNFGM